MLFDDRLMLAQSPLGWTFRKISKLLNKDAARQFLRRCLDEDHSEELRQVLGKNYKLQHEIFLPYIVPDQLRNIKFLAVGGNGTVWSALWDRSISNDLGAAREVAVALKRVPARRNLSKEEALEKFLYEVWILISKANPDGSGIFGVERQPFILYSIVRHHCSP